MRITAELQLRLFALVASLVLVGLAVVRVSSAAFATSAQHDSASTFGAASIGLTVGTPAVVPFNVSDMVPGETVEACVTVTYSGHADPGPVRLYASGFQQSADPGLAEVLQVTVQQDDGTASGDCTDLTGATTIQTAASDTIASLGSLTTYAAGVGDWNPASDGAAIDYHIAVTLDAGATDAVQGETAQLTFVWGLETAGA